MKLATLIQCAIVVTTLCSKLQAQEFQCSGNYVLQIFGPTDAFISTNNFEVTVSGGKLLILTSNINSHIYKQVASDAGTIYELVTWPTGNRAAKVDDGTYENYLWLAYASSSYFPEGTNHGRLRNFWTPLWILNAPPPNYEHESSTFKAEWSKSTLPPYLPKKIIYFSDENYPKPPPFDKEYTNALYETFGVTNLSGLEIPTSFKFTRFGICDKKLQPRMMLTGQLASFKTKILPPNFRPQFTGSMRVMDLRLKLPGVPGRIPFRPFNYEAKDGIWPELKELQPQYERELKTRQQHQKAVEKRSLS